MNDKTVFLPTSGNVHVGERGSPFLLTSNLREIHTDETFYWIDQSPYQAIRSLNRMRETVGDEKVDMYSRGRVRIIK
jgi:hypothetical protein